MTTRTTESPFEIRNIRSFIAFRIFFNARFYYPVFTILFLDFGLSLEQFALLNVAWAVTIVILEVPSGAMADVIGRRNLLIFARWRLRDSPNFLQQSDGDGEKM